MKSIFPFYNNTPVLNLQAQRHVTVENSETIFRNIFFVDSCNFNFFRNTESLIAVKYKSNL